MLLRDVQKQNVVTYFGSMTIYINDIPLILYTSPKDI